MKSLDDFRTVIEEESDYSKFDILVRAGLADKTQLQRLHKILGKMGEERPNFTMQEKQLVQGLFSKMVDLITTNKQIFQQSRRAVKEETELDEAIIDTSDYKVDRSGRKYKAHRIKVGDTVAQVGDDPEPVKEEVLQLDEAMDPPYVLVLKRRAIRLYPDGTKVALYYSDRLDKVFSVPYSTNMEPVIQAEETIIEDVIKHLQNIKDKHQMSRIKHQDGTSSNIDVQTAHALLTVHNALNDENKKKFSDMMSKSKHHMSKAAEFAWKSVK